MTDIEKKVEELEGKLTETLDELFAAKKLSLMQDDLDEAEDNEELDPEDYADSARESLAEFIECEFEAGLS